jgi:Short C-terminal domain
MKKTITTTLISALVLSACAGRPANPVMVDQVGDNKKTCATLEAEMKGVQAEIQRLLPESDKSGKNIGLGVAGAFLLVPLFFMDLTESEKIEINSYRQRYNRLNILATEKKCAFAEVATDAQLEKEAEKKAVDNSKTITQKIEELNGLLKKGLITQREYDNKKAELLKSM